MDQVDRFICEDNISRFVDPPRLGLNVPRAFVAVCRPDALLRIWMKFVKKPYGCFCHQLSIVTPNNGVYFGCASLLEYAIHCSGA